jgi:hypothetical protein
VFFVWETGGEGGIRTVRELSRDFRIFSSETVAQRENALGVVFHFVESIGNRDTANARSLAGVWQEFEFCIQLPRIRPRASKTSQPTLS